MILLGSDHGCQWLSEADAVQSRSTFFTLLRSVRGLAGSDGNNPEERFDRQWGCGTEN